MSLTVTLIPGDGIGPEITDAVVRVLDRAGAGVAWDRRLAGQAAVAAVGAPLPADTLDSIARTGLALKGPLETPVAGGYRSVNVELRTHFDLYANVRPAATLRPGGRYERVDIVLVRENTEGLYSGVERWVPVGGDAHGAAEAVAVVTRAGADRIVRFAFEYALARGRRLVTLVHKANILKLASGLFLEVGRRVAAGYEGRVRFEERIIDAMAMQLVLRPEAFDVVVTTNMFGDILSDEIAGLVGGLGLAPGANIGERAAIFEAVHGTAPDIAGRGVANPGALLLAACMLLEHAARPAPAERIRRALGAVLRDGGVLTPDLGGAATTAAFTDAVIARLS